MLDENERCVVYHSHNLQWQGAQNSLFEIAKGINACSRYKSLLVVSSKDVLLDLYNSENIHVYFHPFPSEGFGDDVVGMESLLSKLADAYHQLNASVIHANTLQCYYSVLAAFKAGIPVVWNIRESEEPSTYFDYLPKCLRSQAFEAVAKADAVVFVAKSTMNLWKKYFDGNNFYQISNGVDVNRLKRLVTDQDKISVRNKLDINEKDICILNVGTVCERKNQLELLKAYKKIILAGVKNTVLILVGISNYEYSRKVISQAEDVTLLGGRIILINETSGEAGQQKLAEFYLAADIFNICSLVESYPRVVIEAYSFGLPVVASNCFGTVEQVVHGVSGYLYDSGDIEMLSEYLNNLIVDKKLLKSMQKNAVSRQQELSTYSSMLEQYNKIYDQITS